MKVIGIIRNDVGANVCSMSILKEDLRVKNSPRHRHAEFEIALTVKGQGRFAASKGPVDISEGDVFILPANEPHSITDIFQTESCDRIETLSIRFSPSFVWDNGNNYLLGSYLDVFLNRKKDAPIKLDRDSPSTGEIAELIQKIKSEFTEQHVDYEIKIKMLLVDILILLRRRYEFVDNNCKKTSLRPVIARQLENALNYIDLHFTEDLTLDDVAAKANFSKFYFCTVFKKFCGLTPWDYVNIKRTESAISMVNAAQGASMLDIALKCGFNNTANFYKIFKKITGVTPKIFRE